MPASDWIGSTRNAANFRVASFRSSAPRSSKGIGSVSGQHRAESFAPERIAHQRKRAARQAVKRAVRIQQASSPGVRARELDRGLHALAARTRKRTLGQLSTRAPAQSLAEFPGALGDVALHHRRSALSSSSRSAANHRRMVVARRCVRNIRRENPESLRPSAVNNSLPRQRS